MTIFMVNRNADTNEGRGPMVFEQAFTNLENAKALCEKMSGVQGRKFHKWTFNESYQYKNFNSNYTTRTHSLAYWDGGNDWEIQILETAD